MILSYWVLKQIKCFMTMENGWSIALSTYQENKSHNDQDEVEILD